MYHDKVYDYYSKQLDKPLDSQAREILHWLYTGTVTTSAKDLAESSKLNMLSTTCRGNIHRSFDMLDTLEHAKVLEETDEDPEAQSRRRNSIKTGKIGKDIEEDLNGKEDKDNLIYGLAAGKTDSLEDLSVEDMKSRNELHKLMKNFERVIKLFGFLYESINELKKKKRLPDPTSFSSVVTGNSLQDLLMSEFLKLADPDAEAMFNMQFIQEQLLQYERHSNKEVGRGEVHIFLDRSSSMWDYRTQIRLPDGMQTFSFWELGLALTLTLVRASFDDGRKPKVSTFNTALQHIDTTSMSVALENILKLSCGGGTVIESVLSHVRHTPSEGRDIFIITDGFDNVLSQTIKATKDELAKYNSKIYFGHLSCGYPAPVWMAEFDMRFDLTSNDGELTKLMEVMI